MLNTYLANTQLLLQSTSAQASQLYTTANLTTFINLARSQLAGEARCIRNFASLTLAASTRSYAFSSVVLGSPSTGIQGIFNIWQALVNSGTGYQWMQPRPVPWFTLYFLGLATPNSGKPTTWCQYGQGVTGSILVDPVPAQTYTLLLDTICYPVPLADDTTAEAIPYPWTDCVPFFAAYYALMSAQRSQDAEMMYKRYEEYARRARDMSNPDVMTSNYVQSADLTLSNKLGISPQGGQ